MKRILLAACLIAGSAQADSPVDTLKQTLQSYQVAQSFDCRNASCKRLRSCAEACYKLHQCGQNIRDGDNDGIPCENLCSRRC